MKSGLVFAAPLLLSACFPSFELPHGGGGAGTTATQTVGVATASVGTGGGGGGAGGAGPSPCGTAFQVKLGDFTDATGSIQSIVTVNGQIIVGGYSGNGFAGVQKGFFLLLLDELEPSKTITVIPLGIPGAQDSEPVISLAVQNGAGTTKTLLVATSTVGTLHVERFDLPLMGAPSTSTPVLTCDVGSGIKDGRLASNGSQVVLAAQLGLGANTPCTVGGCTLPITQGASTMLLPIGKAMLECDKLLVLPPEGGQDSFSYPRIALGRFKGSNLPTDVALTYNAGTNSAVTHRAALATLTDSSLAYQLGTSALIGSDMLGSMPSIPIVMDKLSGPFYVAGSFGPSIGLHSVFIARRSQLPVSNPPQGVSLLGTNTSSLAVSLDSDSGRLLFVGTLDTLGLLGLGDSAADPCKTGACPFWGVYDDNLQLLDHQLVDPSASDGVVASAGVLRCNSVLWSGSFNEPVTLVGMDPLAPNGRSAFLARRPLK